MHHAFLSLTHITILYYSTHYKQGAVTLFALNLNKGHVAITLPAHIANSTIKAFVLQAPEPGEQSLYSR